MSMLTMWFNNAGKLSNVTLDTMLLHTIARANWPLLAIMLCKQIGGHFKVQPTACELYGLNKDWVSFII